MDCGWLHTSLLGCKVRVSEIMMDGEAEEQRPKWVPLLHPVGQLDGFVCPKQSRRGRVGRINKLQQSWDTLLHGPQHLVPTDGIERIPKIQL